MKIRILQTDNDAQEVILEIAIELNLEDQLLSHKACDQRWSVMAFGDSALCAEQVKKICLLGFLTSDIVLEEQLQSPIKTTSGFFSYLLYARVYDANNRHVRLGDVDIFLDAPIPKGIADGSIVSFKVQRLDWLAE